MSKPDNILLDLDGVLADFFTPALAKLNDFYSREMTADEYIKHQIFNMNEVFDISVDAFWTVIDNNDFWFRLKPFSWAEWLIDRLLEVAPVTICTSPSTNYDCISQKLRWCQSVLQWPSSAIMFGSRKYLMANPKNLLIDDYPKNVRIFREYGGSAILVPSNWNTPDLTFDDVFNPILQALE